MNNILEKPYKFSLSILLLILIPFLFHLKLDAASILALLSFISSFLIINSIFMNRIVHFKIAEWIIYIMVSLFYLPMMDKFPAFFIFCMVVSIYILKVAISKINDEEG